MVLRQIGAGLVLVGTLLVAGCCHTCGKSCAPPPAVVGAAPVIPTSPCCGTPAPAPAPAPCCNNGGF